MDIVDLTEHADLEAEAARAGADPKPRFGPSAVAEDAGKIVNGRAEGLVMSATKPLDGSPLGAQRRSTESVSRVDGRLVSGNGTAAEDRKVYLIQRGRKHWVVNTGWLAERGMRIEDTVQIDSRFLHSIIAGLPAGA